MADVRTGLYQKATDFGTPMLIPGEAKSCNLSEAVDVRFSEDRPAAVTLAAVVNPILVDRPDWS